MEQAAHGGSAQAADVMRLEELRERIAQALFSVVRTAATPRVRLEAAVALARFVACSRDARSSVSAEQLQEAATRFYQARAATSFEANKQHMLVRLLSGEDKAFTYEGNDIFPNFGFTVIANLFDKAGGHDTVMRTLRCVSKHFKVSASGGVLQGGALTFARHGWDIYTQEGLPPGPEGDAGRFMRAALNMWAIPLPQPYAVHEEDVAPWQAASEGAASEGAAMMQQENEVIDLTAEMIDLTGITSSDSEGMWTDSESESASTSSGSEEMLDDSASMSSDDYLI